MLIPIPMKLTGHRTGDALPLANAGLIAANVLAWLLVPPPTWWLGPDSGLASLLTHAFVHAGFLHLLFNMWALWVFGNPVNRRLGNGTYLLAYAGAIVFVGLVAKLFAGRYLLGASGGVFAVMAIAVLLLPSAQVLFHFLAAFPLTLLLGLFKPPEYPLFWIVRWGAARISAVWGLVLLPLVEVVGMLTTGLSNWTHLAHLLGFVAGIAAVLLLPRDVSMGRRAPAGF